MQAQRKINGSMSKMLSRITGRNVAEEARRQALEVLMRARDRRWKWLGHILRLEAQAVIRKVLMNCIRPTPDSPFGDVPHLDSRKAVEFAANRGTWTPQAFTALLTSSWGNAVKTVSNA